MDQLKSLRTFVRVIDEGSFAGAARALELAPAVVTRQIAELEEHLGARLINRTTRRLALTDIGETYLERARQLLADLEEADALASHASAEPRGALRVLVTPAFATHQLAKHLPRFRAAYPRVYLELGVPGPVETVDENYDVSLIIVGRQLAQGDYVARVLARSEIVLCASPEYLDRRGRPTHPSEVTGHDALLPPVQSVRNELTFVRGASGDDEPPGEVVSISPSRSVALSTIHIDTTYAAALAGMGIAGLPSFVAEEALLEGALERVLPQWRVMDLTIYAGMPTRKHVPARTRAFVEFLVQTFGGEAKDPWLVAAGCPTR